tara:strand:- start:315 stop:551 length:237 start_codon:yes stop_codon:yes gene_type:complete
METKLVQSLFHAKVREAEARNGGKKIRDEGTFRGIFHDAVDEAKSRLDDVTFDDVMGVNEPVLGALVNGGHGVHIYRG